MQRVYTLIKSDWILLASSLSLIRRAGIFRTNMTVFVFGPSLQSTSDYRHVGLSTHIWLTNQFLLLGLWYVGLTSRSSSVGSTSNIYSIDGNDASNTRGEISWIGLIKYAAINKNRAEPLKVSKKCMDLFKNNFLCLVPHCSWTPIEKCTTHNKNKSAVRDSL